MPAANIKQYGAITRAGSNTPQGAVTVAPNNPRRILLIIQNTGANLGYLQFKNPVKGDGSDFAIEPGGMFERDQAETCPTQAISLGSVALTTWAILEGEP